MRQLESQEETLEPPEIRHSTLKSALKPNDVADHNLESAASLQ